MKIRSFIAINLSEKIKIYLKELLSKLRKIYPQGIKWIKPDGLHITLHFLGYVDESQLKKISEIIQSEIKQLLSKQIELKLTEINAFPNLSRPKVIFIACEELEGDYLKQLRKKIGNGLEKMGIKTDYRQWQAHITLGRVKNNLKIRAENIKIENLKFSVRSIDLMKSELTPNGAKYSKWGQSPSRGD